jgi:hypothetical protein
MGIIRNLFRTRVESSNLGKHGIRLSYLFNLARRRLSKTCKDFFLVFEHERTISAVCGVF